LLHVRDDIDLGWFAKSYALLYDVAISHQQQQQQQH
jgi:hypothetical protein